MESRMRKSLGKGLEALLTAPAPAAAASELTVPIHQIVPNPEQPRRHFDDEALSLLADSIRRHGLLQPLVARRIAGRYELSAGERRRRAALRAGGERVPGSGRGARCAAAAGGGREGAGLARESGARRLSKRGAARMAAARRDQPGKRPAAIVVGYAAVGAAVILGRSLRDAARTTLAWLLAREGAAPGRARRA